MGRRLLNRKIGYREVNGQYVAMSRSYYHSLVQQGVFGPSERLGRKVVVQEAFVREWANGGQKSTRSIVAGKIAQENQPVNQTRSGGGGQSTSRAGGRLTAASTSTPRVAAAFEGQS